MTHPIAVLLSDVHFTLNTLEVATQAYIAAKSKAEELQIPLVLCGDTLDTKAIIRAECANRVIDLVSGTKVEIFVLVGNHDLCNEKGVEHSLNFLKPHCNVIDTPTKVNLSGVEVLLVPYQHDSEKLKQLLSSPNNPNTLIIHQGVNGANMGHYIQDKTSLDREWFKDYRVISGHYHARQDIKCGRPRKCSVGLFSYVGNPYTFTFSEANDPDKGFQILNSDGLLNFMPTNLRKHVVIESTVKDFKSKKFKPFNTNDLVWVKIKDVKSEFLTLPKKEISKILGLSNFKLDYIPVDSSDKKVNTDKVSDSDILDSIIDDLNETKEHKTFLKTLWRDLVD